MTEPADLDHNARAHLAADLSKAPLPTQQTLRRRRSIPVQLTRFAVFNTRMLRMVLKGHGH